MNKPEEAAGNVQETAVFFKQPAWTRLLEDDHTHGGAVFMGGLLRACTPESSAKLQTVPP